MRCKVTEQGRQLTPDDIAAVERAIGTKLPREYKAFLLVTNGGVPEPDEVVANLPKGNDTVPVQCFLSAFADNKVLDIVGSYRLFCEANSGELLPIADVGEGSRICLGIAAWNFGQVFFHDYYAKFEKRHPVQLGDQSNYKLFDSFSAFLRSFIQSSY